jgi:hypothetical protein
MLSFSSGVGRGSEWVTILKAQERAFRSRELDPYAHSAELNSVSRQVSVAAVGWPSISRRLPLASSRNMLGPGETSEASMPGRRNNGVGRTRCCSPGLDLLTRHHLLGTQPIAKFFTNDSPVFSPRSDVANDRARTPTDSTDNGGTVRLYQSRTKQRRQRFECF